MISLSPFFFFGGGRGVAQLKHLLCSALFFWPDLIWVSKEPRLLTDISRLGGRLHPQQRATVEVLDSVEPTSQTLHHGCKVNRASCPLRTLGEELRSCRERTCKRAGVACSRQSHRFRQRHTTDGTGLILGCFCKFDPSSFPAILLSHSTHLQGERNSIQ